MKSQPPSPAPPRRPARVAGPDAADPVEAGEDAPALLAPDIVEPPARRSFFERVRAPQISTKKAAHQTSVFLAGFEVAVKMNHVDPLTDGRRDVKSNWVADGEHASVDLESVVKRKQLPHDMQMELQGPALTARADEESMLPLKARFIGFGLSKQFSEDMPLDSTPPRVEVKVEIKLTEKSIGSLAGLAGASQDLQLYAAELARTPAAEVIGSVLTGAVPVVSTIVAGISARRAVAAVRDGALALTDKSLAVLRALADATTVFLPLIGTFANMALVGAAIGLARVRARRATQGGP